MNVAAIRIGMPPPASLPRAQKNAARAAWRVHSGARPSRLGRAALAVAVITAHAAGVAGLIYLGLHTVIPDMTATSPRPIEVAFIAPQERAAPQPPQPAPPQPVKVETPPPVKPKKTPPKPVPAVEPLKAPPQAISEPKPEPPAAPVAETVPPAAPAMQAAPPAAAGPVEAAPVTAARFDADYLHNPAPTYPALSRRMREEGRVLLRVLVSAQGAPVRVELARSSSSSRLDEARPRSRGPLALRARPPGRAGRRSLGASAHRIQSGRKIT